MQTALDRLNQWITEVPVKFNGLSEQEVSRRPQPHKWSRKEILGHLCDSALNNLQRFVRAQYEEQPNTIIQYDQDQWGRLMNYQELPFEHILSFWVSLNKQVAAVWRRISEGQLQNVFLLNEGKMVTLHWLIDDYVDHMEHHLDQIFGSN
ncbi:DinB family protein [Paenibacillus sp.]|uniref:DinB family protein n=1 Tax=Paenibacillus sp. TaxID=58172 RepID=UPI002819D3E6|nr:DinB family protein [Paenibacillus sp.]MDR0270804.1 DinB family protein [Paenibacillus sp.]